MNKYEIESEIKRGAFGVIYKGLVKKTREPVAIKVDHSSSQTLKHESRVIQYLYMAKVRNIPSIYWFGIHEEKPALIMTYYECSLYDYCKERTVDFVKAGMILVKVLDIFENIHKLFVLHRDIKPQNFMVKNGDIYLIDFGLSMFYVQESGEHYPDIESTNMLGSPLFTSINIHMGHRYSRRDDLISLGYMYFYMTGSPFLFPVVEEATDIPPIHIMHPSNQYLKTQKEMEHLRTRFSNLSIQSYMEYVYSIEYAAAPKYESMKRIFMS